MVAFRGECVCYFVEENGEATSEGSRQFGARTSHRKSQEGLDIRALHEEKLVYLGLTLWKMLNFA